MIDNKPKNFQTVSYSRCSACGRVFPESDWNHFTGITAPCCGAKGAARESWPPASVSQLMEMVFRQDVDSPSGAQTAAVLLCSVATLIIENILINHLKTSPGVPGGLDLGGGGDLENLIRAYEKASGFPMAERFQSLAL